MSKTKRVPNLRFQGFTNNWEQNKLSQYLTISNTKNKDLVFNKYSVLSVSDESGVINQIKLQGKSLAGKDLSNYKVLLPNQMVYTKSPLKNSPYGIVKANKGTSGIVSTLYGVYSPLEIADSNFIEYYFTDKLRLNRYLKPIVNIGAKHSMGISDKEFLNHIVIFPNKKEQRNISKFFDKLEHTIDLYQHKLDQLRVLKEILLQKLFANDQHDKPELRFKDFTDKWEKVKIGSLFTESTEKSATGQLLSVSINKGVYPFDETERKNNSSKNKSNYKFVEKYDIAYNSMRMWQGAEGVSYYSGIVSPAYTVLKPQQNSNPEFYAYMFKRAEMLNKFRRYSQGLTSDTWNLKFPILKTISLRTTDIKEQEKIVQLLRMVKDNISLQQKKLTQYQQAKKFLLQQMFI
ncbi:hypothetical protein BHL89_06105 [Limosilactobacillus reuteri]|uniref:restriction endonuclease subunit S n=1 Tax=Limosilactobacillus reuteri TaxID=1598 RepID=UPI000A2E1966|nr:restriction endonuclease subunit S [Limosilactobacillus reuteri]OTA46331.1 hypothetical protein BHL89_06105 [Limosilactobacillus reuteri]